MLKRVITTVVLLPLLIVLINIGGLPLISVMTILSLVGLSELYKAFFKEVKAIHFVGYAFTVIYYLSMYFLGPSVWLLIEMTLLIIAAHTVLVLFYKQIPIRECIVTVYGFFYVSFLLSFIYLTRWHEMGLYYVWLIFTSSFGCDTFAYLIGRSIGRHKLTDTPSPKKSLEGVIGGIAGAALVGALYGLFISRWMDADVPGITFNATVVSVFGAAFSVIGDMSASAIKRYTGIKDFGSLFPGHGGVLDRFDSVIMTAPIVYMVMTGILRIRG